MTTDEQRIFVCEKLLGWKSFKVKIDDEWSLEDGEHKNYYGDTLGNEHKGLPPLTLD